jgi:hypothetical protein
VSYLWAEKFVYVIYLTTLSVTLGYKATDGWMVNEFERIWKETAMGYFKVLSEHLSGETEENQKI